MVRSIKEIQSETIDRIRNQTDKRSGGWTYEDVASAAGLDDEKKDVYVELMRERFNGPDDRPKEGEMFHLQYSAEWAARFKTNNARTYADEETAAVLDELGYEVRTARPEPHSKDVREAIQDE